MGAVEYIDYNNTVIPTINMFNALMRKRRSFEHEREVRAIIWRKRNVLSSGSSPDGRLSWRDDSAKLSIDLNEFVEAIFVSPSAPKWFLDVVVNVVSAYGVRVPVHQSSLTEDPVY